MKGFWTCGPFKEIEDRRSLAQFRMEQMEKFLDILENLKKIENQIVSGSLEEKYIGLLMENDIEKDLHTILGIEKDDGEEKDTEVLGKAILESLTGTTEE